MCKYFFDSSKNIKVFFVRIFFNKFTIKFLFYFFLSFYFVPLVVSLYPFSSIFFQAYSHESVSKFYNLKYFIVFACLLLQMNSLFLLALIVLLLKWHIVWIKISSKFMSRCCSTIHNYFNCKFFVYKSYIALFFLVCLLFHSYFFYDLNDILLQFLANSYGLILLLYFFYLTILFYHYLLLFLYHFLPTIYCLNQPCLYSV